MKSCALGHSSSRKALDRCNNLGVKVDEGGWFSPGIGGSFYNVPGIRHAMRSLDTPPFAFWALRADSGSTTTECNPKCDALAASNARAGKGDVCEHAIRACMPILEANIRWQSAGT